MSSYSAVASASAASSAAAASGVAVDAPALLLVFAAAASLELAGALAGAGAPARGSLAALCCGCCLPRRAGAGGPVEEELREVKAKIGALSTVNDFVAKSKLERRRGALEKEVEGAARAAGAAYAAAAARAAAVGRYVKAPVYIALALALWRAPLARAPPALLGLALRPLALPGWPAGTLGVLGALYVGHAVAKALVSACLGTLGVAPAAPPAAAAGGGILGMLQPFMGVLGLLQRRGGAGAAPTPAAAAGGSVARPAAVTN